MSVSIDRARVTPLHPSPQAGDYTPILIFEYNALGWRTSKLTVGGSFGEMLENGYHCGAKVGKDGA